MAVCPTTVVLVWVLVVDLNQDNQERCYLSKMSAIVTAVLVLGKLNVN